MTGTKVIKVTRDRFKANEFKKWTADSLLSATSLGCIYSFYKSMIEIRTKLFHLLWPWSLIRVNLQCYIKHAVIKIWFFNYFLINAMQYLINVKWLFLLNSNASKVVKKESRVEPICFGFLFLLSDSVVLSILWSQ